METWKKCFAAEELVEVLVWAHRRVGGDGLLAGGQEERAHPCLRDGEEVAGKPL